MIQQNQQNIHTSKPLGELVPPIKRLRLRWKTRAIVVAFKLLNGGIFLCSLLPLQPSNGSHWHTKNNPLNMKTRKSCEQQSVNKIGGVCLESGGGAEKQRGVSRWP